MFTPHHVSHVRCYVSHVTCHMSGVRYHISKVRFFFTKWWSESVEGLLLIGTTPSSSYIFILFMEKNIYKPANILSILCILNVLLSMGDFRLLNIKDKVGCYLFKKIQFYPKRGKPRSSLITLPFPLILVITVRPCQLMDSDRKLKIQILGRTLLSWKCRRKKETIFFVRNLFTKPAQFEFVIWGYTNKVRSVT